jgi:ankyrin repeat protein
MRAVARGHAPIVRMLLAAEADYDGSGDQWDAALRAAARGGHRRVFEALRGRVPLARQKAVERTLNARDPKPERADPRVGRLVTAAAAGRLDQVRRLIALGIPVNTADRSLKLPLAGAAAAGHTEVVKELLTAGADTEARQDLVTPIWTAADRGHLEVVRLLLAAGAGASAPSLSRETPLHRALANGHVEVAKCLVRAGAALGFDKGDTSILEMARKRGDAELRDLMADLDGAPSMLSFAALMDAARAGDLAGVEAALAQGAPVQLADDHDRNALAEAAAGHLPILRRLLASGIPAELRPRVLSRALTTAIARGPIEAVRALIEAGADVDSPGGVAPHTPLLIAVDVGRAEAVRLLLESGADPSRDVDAVSPLGVAYDKPEIRAMLKAWGARKTTDGVPLSRRRGVLTLDVDESWLAVRAAVDESSAAFAALRGAKAVGEDVYGRPVTVSRRGFAAFRLRGHAWTLITDWGDDQSQPSVAHWLAPRDAEALSRRMGTRAVFFGVSDTASAMTYNLFEGGELLEKFEAGEGEGVVFESSLRRLTRRQLRRQDEALEAIFTDLGLLVYSMSSGIRLFDAVPGRTAPLYFPGLDDEDVERLDYIELA